MQARRALCLAGAGILAIVVLVAHRAQFATSRQALLGSVSHVEVREIAKNQDGRHIFVTLGDPAPATKSETKVVSKNDVIARLQAENADLAAEVGHLHADQVRQEVAKEVEEAKKSEESRAPPRPQRKETIRIQVVTPPPEPKPTRAPSAPPVEPKLVITTVVEERNTTTNGTTTHFESTHIIVDEQTTVAPVKAVATPAENSTTEVAPEPHFVVNVITDSTPLPTTEPSVATEAPTAAPTPSPSLAPTTGPTYPKGTYVVNVDVSDLPPKHGPIDVPVAMPDGETTVVEVPASD